MSASHYKTLTNFSPAIELDPSAPGTFARYAFAIEGSLNVLGGLVMILTPYNVLSYLVTDPSEINHAAASLMQWVGAFALSLSLPLFLAFRNTRFAMESRRMVYYTLGAGELALMPLMLWQAWGPDAGWGFTPRALTGACTVLLPPLLLRIYVLFGNPNLMGRYCNILKAD